MGKTGILKLFGVFSIVGVVILMFFQEEIMIHLIGPIRDVFLKIFILIPVILFMVSGLFFIGGFVNKRHRANNIIFGIVCFIVALWLSNPSGFEDIANWFSGNPESPKGWH